MRPSTSPHTRAPLLLWRKLTANLLLSVQTMLGKGMD